MKYKNITTRTGRKSVKQDDFHNNLFIGVADMYWDMVDIGISPTEARSLVLRNVKLILDELPKTY